MKNADMVLDSLDTVAEGAFVVEMLPLLGPIASSYGHTKLSREDLGLQ